MCAVIERQRGSGALLMVIIILLMGTLLLNATRRQLSDSLSLVADQRLYLQQQASAASALAWGGRLRWGREAGWQCQQITAYAWRACLQRLPSAILLRADSGPGTLAWYRWVAERAGNGVRALPHGWLDFCPLAEKGACDVDQ